MTVYDSLLALLDRLDVEIVDLAADPAYAHAGLDPSVPDPRLEDLAKTAGHDGAPIDLFVGWSFGGLVALEAARYVEPPPPVLLLDTVAPLEEMVEVRTKVQRWFADYLSWRAGQRLAMPCEEPGPGRLEELYEPALAAGALSPDVTAGGFRMLSRAYAAGLERNARIAGAAAAPRLSTVTLVRPEQGLLDDAPANGWEVFVDEVRVVACAGDHYSMLTEAGSVAVIAAEIERVVGLSGSRELDTAG